MARYVALLRGINVGGNKKVPMAELRAMTEELGFTDVKTLLQSGNLVFTTKSLAPRKLEQQLESATHEVIGVECSYLVRTAAEWTALIDANPYDAMAKSDPSHLVVHFCRESPDSAAVKRLLTEARGEEELTVIGRELFIRYPDGIGESKLALALSKNRLGTIGSARNWNTVLKIAAVL
jgi:uncharacterized protein (DUF1697 family)